MLFSLKASWKIITQCICDILQLYVNFKKFNDEHKNYKNSLPESEILDIIDGVCNSKDTFNM